MARVKTGYTTKQRHKKILKAAKGYFGSKHRLYKTAKEQLMHSGQYAYRDRRQKKRDFRKLWITRINAAARMNGLTYSKLIAGLKKANVTINRKMLAEIAVSDEKAFAELAEIAKEKGHTSLGLTNHGNTSGLIQHYDACKAVGIKPIMGCEGYFLPKKVEQHRGFHLILVAKNLEGFKNLNIIHSEGEKQKFYNPIWDFNLLELELDNIIDINILCVVL